MRKALAAKLCASPKVWPGFMRGQLARARQRHGQHRIVRQPQVS